LEGRMRDVPKIDEAFDAIIVERVEVECFCVKCDALDDRVRVR
jgi:hypothetical protein